MSAAFMKKWRKFAVWEAWPAELFHSFMVDGCEKSRTFVDI